jgi:HAD superfamily hydrolase (TIGR01509 family)
MLDGGWRKANVRFLLWDHDGVLVDTEPLYFAATQECIKLLGVDIDQAEYLRLTTTGRTSWDLARQRGIPESAIVEARKERDRRYQQYLMTREIEIEGVIDVLTALSLRYRMAIVTTSKRSDFDLIHRSRKIRDFFEFVLTVEDCTRVKPDPDPYLRALAKFNARPDEVLVIEDSARGLAAALAAGLKCVIIRNPFTAGDDFSGASHVLRSIRDLPQVLS